MPARMDYRSRAHKLRAQRTLGRAGLLAALAPLVIPALTRIAALGAARGGYDALPGIEVFAALLAVVLLDGALNLARRPALGRTLIVAGGLGLGLLGALGLRHSPAQAMTLMLTLVMFGAWIYFAPEAGEPGHTMRNSRIARARMAALGSIIAVFVMVGFRMSAEPWALAYPIASLAITLALALRAVGRIRWHPVDIGVAVAAVVSVSGAILLRSHPDLASLALLPVPAALLASLGRRMIRDPLYEAGWTNLLLEQPARLLAGTFVLGGLAGAVALSLPICSSAANTRVLLLDAAFTAFSAICVTGLAVVDTASAYSIWGQAVILLLIQLGGLGIMSFSIAAMVLLGQRLSLREEGAAVELLGGDRRAGLDRALRRMLLVTGVSEGLGALILGLVFRAHGDPWLVALWRGSFTSISAYCNAGFALQGDSLVGYQTSAAVLHVVALLIIVGGLGPVVVASLPAIVRRRRRASLHARIVLLSTAALLVVPAFLIGALEWHHSLAPLSVPARLHNAWFQSVTTRTAGFNSIDFGALTPATQTLIETLMFIGGSPGSTAGGIKTTTVFVLVCAVIAVARLRPVVVWGGWAIPQATTYRAAAVVTLGALSVVFGVFVIQLTQALDTDVAIFEVVSALGTVGLSIGGTAQLDSVGKLIIIVCMFMGRVAPLTLFLIFSRPTASPGSWKYPQQEVSVG